MIEANLYGNKKSLWNKLRQKRFNFLLSKLTQISKPYKIIDIGGTEQYWEKRGITGNKDFDITIVNLTGKEPKYPNIRFVNVDARDLSIFKSNEFDISYSNSVIEHLGNIKEMNKMAKESRRISKYFFIQTPNKYFPIEPHFLLPFFQFLPEKIKIKILTNTRLVEKKKRSSKEAKSWVQSIKLLSMNELQRLYPKGKIYKEKIFGITKSYIIHNFK